MTGVPKFQGVPCPQAILVDPLDEPAEEPRFLEELLVRPELQASTVVTSKRITVFIRNVSTKELTLMRGMPIAYLFPVDVMSSSVTKMPNVELGGKVTPSSFNFVDLPIPREWKERLVTKMMEHSEVFSTQEFDVGCSKSTHHTIKTTEEKPF